MARKKKTAVLKNEDSNQNEANNNQIGKNDNNIADVEVGLHELTKQKEDIKSAEYAYPSYENSIKKRFYRCLRKNVHVFPLGVAICVPLLCFVTYGIAVHYDGVEPIWPYVSDTGTGAGAGFFSMMLDIVAILVTITSFYRYRMVKYEIKQIQILPKSDSDSPPEIVHQYDNMNFLCFCLALVTAFGMIAVGNFRVSEMVPLHFFSAGLCFFPMFVCACAQTYLTHWLSKHRLESKPISMAVITLVGSVSLFCCIMFAGLSLTVGFDNVKSTDFRLKWNSSQDGYFFHVASAFSELLAITSLSPFSVCLFNRFLHFEHFDKI